MTQEKTAGYQIRQPGNKSFLGYFCTGMIQETVSRWYVVNVGQCTVVIVGISSIFVNVVNVIPNVGMP